MKGYETPYSVALQIGQAAQMASFVESTGRLQGNGCLVVRSKNWAQ